MEVNVDLLKKKCGTTYAKLETLNNTRLNEFVSKYVELCNPDSVYVCDNSDEDKEYIRRRSIELGEEKPLAIQGHTIHFDGPQDQARDKAQTKYLLPKEKELGKALNCVDKDEGMYEINEIMKNIMAGKEMYLLFFCLGPTDSDFSIPVAQITDSAYVAHSEYILYRRGYNEFKKVGDNDMFFKMVHSAGELENGVSKNVDKRRIYIDLDENIVFSTNTQYAGNTVGLKKLSLRLAIKKASEEGWLAEHMLVMAVKGPGDRKTYFTGAFPSACGKTSTAMLEGESIVGDDIAYLRRREDGVYAVNVESGIFGIIQDVNPEDAPVIWEALNKPGEVIRSNILVTDEGYPYWLGDGREVPEAGTNFQGKWEKSKTDDNGKPIPHAHKNARYTISIYSLNNADTEIDNPKGVLIKGIIYGGRDSSIWPPVREAINWQEGVILMGGSLESETTAATLGQEGVRKFCPMSNLDFVAIPLGKYITNHLKFVEGMENPPSIFAVNYFLKDKEGKYLTGMHAKRVWAKWMELRVNGDVEVEDTPIGRIPKYKDIKKLFKEILDEEYTEEDYLKQFTIRVEENIKKIDRIIETYRILVPDTPQIVYDVLEEQKKRLMS